MLLEPQKCEAATPGEEGWLTRQRTLALVLIAGTAIAFYLSYRLILPFLPALAWAVTLAVLTHPLHAWVLRYVRRENIAAGLSVVIVATAILAPALFVTHQLASEAAQNVDKLQEAQDGTLRAAIAKREGIGPAFNWLENNFEVRGAAQEAISQLTGDVAAVLTGSVGAILQLFIMLFFLFFLFRDRVDALTALRTLLPLSDEESSEVLGRVSDTIHATVYGTLVVAMVQGLLGGLMFWWLGLPAPVLWGFVMALLAIVPYLGAFVIWVPAAVYLALEGNFGKAVALTLWGTVVIGLIDNLLYPMLVGHKLRLHTMLVFMAIVGGIYMFGGTGLVLGPLILAVTLALLDVWKIRTRGGRAAEDGSSVNRRLLIEGDVSGPVQTS